jgi:ABC-type nitrate/sulfonate/bicarbonate transport system substrate-binding protein
MRPALPRSPAARLTIAALTILASGVLSACGGDGAPGGGAAGDGGAVTFRYQSGASYGSISAFELADHLGYYRGTDVRITSVGVSKSGPEDIQAIAAGSNDIAWTNTAPIINADANGLDIKAIVAAGTTLTRDLRGRQVSIGGLLVRRDRGIDGLKDLAGKTVSVNVRSAQAEYAIRRGVERAGGDPDRIDYVVVAPPNEIQSIRQGLVDAAYSWTPAYNKGQEDPDVAVLASEGDLLGDLVTGGFAFSQRFLDAHPEAVREFVAGYVRAWAWAWEHPEKLQQEAAEIITANKGDASLSRYVYPFGSRENALIQDGDIQFYLDQLTKQGDIEAGEVKPSDIYTNEFNPATSG